MPEQQMQENLIIMDNIIKKYKKKASGCWPDIKAANEDIGSTKN